MKEHVMNLTPAPMQEIRTGNKTIELRLNDEKRKQISVGMMKKENKFLSEIL